MQRRFQRLWFWTQDDAPDWVSAYVGGYAWRPWCWVRGYHQPHHCDVYYEVCTWCLVTLWSRKRDGSPNPLLGVDRAPAGWRRLRQAAGGRRCP